MGDGQRLRRRLIRWGRLLNRPFVVTVLGGLLVLGISTWVQNRSWELQQRFLIRQATVTRKVAEAQTTRDDLVKHVGSLLTAEGLIVGAHEARLETKHLLEAIERNGRLREEWDLAEESLRMRVRAYFPDAAIRRSWEDVQRRLKDLYSLVEELQTFATSGPSREHQQQIADCRGAIERIEGQLADLATAMNRHIDSLAAERQ